jgi:murein DD-endopeptidase MepM/ murein hydrolase activator NlpD
VVSDHQEYAPIQIVADALPADSETLGWVPPAPGPAVGPFMGMAGWPASHEGTDYVQPDPAVVNVAVVAAAAGQVVYVRRGCPQSAWFVPNHQQRECGAGWGNHVVIAHANGLLTRYAHLAPDSILVQVGDRLSGGSTLGLMGNSGRSDIRHLHFELGQKGQPMAACASAQSFDHVYDPAAVGL